MPKNKFQDVVFMLLMVVCMVYCMTLYNMFLNFGMTYANFGRALAGMWIEAPVAFIMVRYVSNPTALRFIGKVRKTGVTQPILIQVLMAGVNVMIMCPAMTLFVTILHNGLTANLLLDWFPKLLVNFPFALVIQIFYVGPFVRAVFRFLFRNSLAERPIHAETAATARTTATP